MAKNSDITQALGLLVIVIIALALTPTIQTAVTDSGYGYITEYKVINPAVANTTTLAHSARNGTAYFTVTLNATNSVGHTALTHYTEFNLTAATTMTFYLLNGTVPYNATIFYYWLSLDSAGQALIALVPIFWVTLIISALVVFIIYKMKFHG